MEPEDLKKWVSVLTDLVVLAAGTFMLIFGTTRITDPATLTIVVGGGITLLGALPAHRVDLRRNEKQHEPELPADERWSHLP